MKSRIDILAVGDTASDVFIELEEYVRVDQAASADPRLSLPYGVKIPFKRSIEVPAVGNAANAAVSFAKLGLKSALLAHVGDDYYGHQIVRSLVAAKVMTHFLHMDRGKKTNYHYLLWYKTDRTQLMNAEAYDWRWPQLSAADQPSWIYLSRLGGNTLALQHSLAEYVKKHSAVKLAFQPDRFQIELGTHKLADIYARSSLVFCNREEAVTITAASNDEIPVLMQKMHQLGPKTVVITDGPGGSYSSDGNQILFMRNYPDPKPPLERTGAGDAYASTVTAAIAQGQSLNQAMLWAPINSMSVVQQVGAQAGLLTPAQIKHWLAKAPADYKPRPVQGKG